VVPQKLGDRRVLFQSSIMLCIAAAAITCVDTGISSQECLDDHQVAQVRGAHERRDTLRESQIHICTQLYQCERGLSLTRCNCDHESTAAHTVYTVDDVHGVVGIEPSIERGTVTARKRGGYLLGQRRQRGSCRPRHQLE